MADVLSAVSVFLVFLTFLLGGIEKEITEMVKIRKPAEAQVEALRDFNARTKRLLWLKVIPVTLVFSITFYCLLPRTVGIIRTSNFALWNFNELNTIFVFIETGVLGLSIFSISKARQLVKKYKSTT